jgi:hypothetical protein
VGLERDPLSLVIIKEELLERKRTNSSQLAPVVSYGYVPSLPILVTLMMEALSYSETSVLTRVTPRNIPEDVIHSSLFNCAL